MWLLGMQLTSKQSYKRVFFFRLCKCSTWHIKMSSVLFVSITFLFSMVQFLFHQYLVSIVPRPWNSLLSHIVSCPNIFFSYIVILFPLYSGSSFQSVILCITVFFIHHCLRCIIPFIMYTCVEAVFNSTASNGKHFG